jgi:hypothetical protein
MTEKELIEKLLFHIVEMRQLQYRFFHGERSVLKEAKEAEKKTDRLIKKFTQELGYEAKEPEQFKQQTLL